MSDEARARLIVVEDDDGLRDLLVEELSDAGHSVSAVAYAEAAWSEIARRRPDVVLSDVRLPGEDGMALLDRVRALPDPPAFVAVTAFGSIHQAVAAIKRGADDFLTKPLDLDHLLVVVGRVLETRRLRRRVTEYETLLGDDDFHGMLGRSTPMLRVFDAVRRIAAGDGPVLVTGESGSGKELVARALHRESARAPAPFVSVNCAGVPADLLESEFFGHVHGAFTGAARDRAGLFQEAAGGMLFLDEIGEMAPALQAKLLRVLESGRVRPVGADRDAAVDVRVVAATNRDASRAVESGELRADLFYRLETYRIAVPPLRERGDDRDFLAMRFLERAAHRLERPVRGFEPGALEALRRYSFPGNVRELANAIERAVTFCTTERIRADDLPERVRATVAAALETPWPASSDGGLPTLAEVERRYIEQVLAQCDGNKRQAARVLDIGRRTLYRRLESDGGGGERE